MFAGEHPDMKLGDISKKLGIMWHELSEDDKQPFKVCS